MRLIHQINPAGGRTRLAFLRLVLALFPLAAGAAERHLGNGSLTADFDDHGLARISIPGTAAALDLAERSGAISIDGKPIDFATLGPAGVTKLENTITYTYQAGGRTLHVEYELRPGWRFVSKRFVLKLPADARCKIDAMTVFDADLNTPISREIPAARATGSIFLRLADPKAEKPFGAFLAIQNPFMKWQRKDGAVSLGYEPAMEWRASYGPFESDRVCLGLQNLTGREFPMRALPEWKYFQDPQQEVAKLPTLDRAESEAMAGCLDAFSLFHPKGSTRVHVPWCENDYQIDASTAAGFTEWKRIVDQCAACGIGNMLLTTSNSEVAPLSGNTDAWSWENCLWLGLGQKIRKGEWDIAKDPMPPSIQDMLDYAKSKKVKLVAYVYPTLGWMQNPEWTAWTGGQTGGYIGADTGVRSFQDWFLDRLVEFQKRTGISGYSFDHWWIAYEPAPDGKHPTSKYAQWYGCRRILEELRRRIPDVVIDGRQQYQNFGPWTWLGGSYPHPTTSDEQPASFENFPDLHFSRVSADRQRWATWRYHVEQFTPWELVPGYISHQTPRNDAKGQTVRDRDFRIRDWDMLGWRYSVISSIGTAPFNHTVSMLPARDETEFKHFLPADQNWLRGWLDWTDTNREILRKLRPIIGPPVLGGIDGTAAVDGDHGFIFLYNPNYRELTASFALDQTIGLTKGDRFVFRELYPEPGKLIGKPGGGLWQAGDKAGIPIKGPEARVLELVPASDIERPAVLGALGTASMEGGNVVLTGVRGEMGTTANVAVLLPAGGNVSSLQINGNSISAYRTQDDVLSADITFAGTEFGHCQQIGTYDPNFAGSAYRTSLKVPKRVFDQLAARRKAWPIPYTKDELLATWLGSDRLLLYIQIADPDSNLDVTLKIDGESVEVRKAFDSVEPTEPKPTFTGYYADLSNLKPEMEHQVEVGLPAGLQPGQFQGLFLENVETSLTSELANELSK